MSGRMATLREKFDPRSLPGLRVWLDAQQPNGFGQGVPADLTALSFWKNLSGHPTTPDAAAYRGIPKYRNANWNRLNTFWTNPTYLGSANFVNADTVTIVTPSKGHYSLSAYQFRCSTATVCGPYIASGDLSTYPQVTPGETITAMAAMRGVVGRHFNASLYWLDSSGAGHYLATGPTVALTGDLSPSGTWAVATVTTVVPVGAVCVALQAYASDALVGDVLQVAGFGVGGGTIPGQYYLPPGNKAGIHFDGVIDAHYITGTLFQDKYTVYAVNQMMQPPGQNPQNVAPISVQYAQPGTAGTYNIDFDLDNWSDYNTFGHYQYHGDAQTDGSAGTAWVGSYLGTSDSLFVAPTIITACWDKSNMPGKINGAAIPGAGAYNGAHDVRNLSATGKNTLLMNSWGFNPSRGIALAYLIYDSAHDPATRRRVENWLSAKYGIPLVRP